MQEINWFSRRILSSKRFRQDSVCIALLVTSCGLTHTSKSVAEECKENKLQTAVVVAKGIERGREILYEDLRVTQIPANSKSLHTFQNVDIAYKRRSKKNLPAGHVCTLEDFNIPPGAWSDDTSLVLYAANDVLNGQKFQAKDIVQKKWPGAGYPQGGFANPYIIIGRKATGCVQKGQLLLISAFNLHVLDELQSLKKTYKLKSQAREVLCKAHP
jgi:Flp pilus assembly protein CpaB